MEAKLAELAERQHQAHHAGSERAVERQHAKGKLLARERIEALLDPGSFNELDLLARHRAHAAGLEERPYTDGVITGWGTIDGRKVFVFSQDFTVFGGALGEVFAEKIHKVMDMALKVGAPVIGLNDGAGARIQEGVVSASTATAASSTATCCRRGVVPQISVILGPCAGGAVYSPAMTDFIFMVRESSHMFITGPDVVKTVTGEEVTLEELGGAMSHASKSRRGHVRVRADEKACLDDVRFLLSLPAVEQPRGAAPRRHRRRPRARSAPSCATSCRPRPNQPYDMKKVIARSSTTASSSSTSRTGPSRSCAASPASTARRRRHRRQPADDARRRARHRVEPRRPARFVRTCDAFNIPLRHLRRRARLPPGVDQEYGGIIRHGAKLLYAYCEATVPRIQIITRKAYGGAYVVMNSKSIGADLAYAWPTAELAVMGPQGAVEIVYRRELQQAADPVSRRAELVDRVHREVREPVHRGRARLHRRRDRPGRDAPQDRGRPRHAAHQARGPAEAQARQRAALIRGRRRRAASYRPAS